MVTAPIYRSTELGLQVYLAHFLCNGTALLLQVEMATPFVSKFYDG